MATRQHKRLLRDMHVQHALNVKIGSRSSKGGFTGTGHTRNVVNLVGSLNGLYAGYSIFFLNNDQSLNNST